jgi:hypothetical protein
MSVPSILEQFDFPSILAGHGYDVGTDPRGDSSGGSGEEGGIPVLWILAGVLLTVVTVGLLVSLNPAGSLAKLKSHGAKALILVVIAAPLIAWTASSGGGPESLIVERWTTAAGKPELIVSLREDDLNELETTDGKRVVGFVCVGGDGQVVVDAKQKWPLPYVNERGYRYPHAHQAASQDQVLQADSCRLRGTTVRLEADVKGVLTP